MTETAIETIETAIEPAAEPIVQPAVAKKVVPPKVKEPEVAKNANKPPKETITTEVKEKSSVDPLPPQVFEKLGTSMTTKSTVIALKDIPIAAPVEEKAAPKESTLKAAPALSKSFSEAEKVNFGF